MAFDHYKKGVENTKNAVALQMKNKSSIRSIFNPKLILNDCVMETGRGWRQNMRFTPHGIEDIMRRERKVVVDDDSETVYSSLHSPLNLSVSQCSQAETDSYKMATRETQFTNCQGDKISTRRKKMRTTFTGRQIFELEKMFEVKKYLNATERSSLSR